MTKIVKLKVIPEKDFEVKFIKIEKYYRYNVYSGSVNIGIKELELDKPLRYDGRIDIFFHMPLLKNLKKVEASEDIKITIVSQTNTIIISKTLPKSIKFLKNLIYTLKVNVLEPTLKPYICIKLPASLRVDVYEGSFIVLSEVSRFFKYKTHYYISEGELIPLPPSPPSPTPTPPTPKPPIEKSEFLKSSIIVLSLAIPGIVYELSK